MSALPSSSAGEAAPDRSDPASPFLSAGAFDLANDLNKLELSFFNGGGFLLSALGASPCLLVGRAVCSGLEDCTGGAAVFWTPAVGFCAGFMPAVVGAIGAAGGGGRLVVRLLV